MNTYSSKWQALKLQFDFGSVLEQISRGDRRLIAGERQITGNIVVHSESVIILWSGPWEKRSEYSSIAEI